MRPAIPISLAALSIILLDGCTVGPDYHAPKPDLPVHYVTTSAPGAATDLAQPKWWQCFKDPLLSALVEQALAGNLDLDIALNRLQAAETELAVVQGESLPGIGASGAVGTGTGSDLTRGKLAPALGSADNTDGSKVTRVGGIDAGWDIDLVGKLRREVEAARDDAAAAEAAQQDLQVTIAATVVRDYLDLRGLQMRRAALEQSIAAAQQTVEFVGQRYRRGLTNELDLTLATRELATLNAEASPLSAQIDATRYALAVLTGRYPEAADAKLIAPAVIPPLPDRIDAGLPVDLLRRRPDIREAERELAGATARVGIATADLFPHLDVSAAVGWQGLAGASTTNPLIWGVGPAASWSLLDFGTLDGLVDIADLRSKRALLAYRQTILTAVQQVDSAAASYKAEQATLGHLDDALAASQRSVTLASERYDRGLTDFLNVLDAQRAEYALESQYAESRQAAAEALVALAKALGGGWQPDLMPPPIRQPQPVVVAAFRRLFDDAHDRQESPQ
jgi:NodT family efflux transporter outer membrane factor (OMF) lipoprotein